MTDQALKEYKEGADKKQSVNAEDVLKLKKEHQERLDEAEDRSRRNNIRIGGLAEEKGESWDETKRKVKLFFKNSLNIDKDIVIQRAHRNKSDGNRPHKGPRVIVALLHNYEDKELLFKQAKLLKGTGYFLSNDYCKNTVDIHKNLWEQVKNLRKENKRAFLGYRKIKIKEGSFYKYIFVFFYKIVPQRNGYPNL